MPYVEHMMQGRRMHALAVATVAMLAGADAGATALQREDARVLSVESGRLLYRESHWYVPGANPERWVLYRCADGGAFARKRVTPRSLPASPDFAFEDGRDGYREGVRSEAGRRAVYLRDGRAPEQARPLQVPAGGVIDAGFDAAVRRHWDALLQGEAVRMQFLVPSRKRFYPVRLRHDGSVQRDGQRAERLKMRLDAWFGFAVPEVTLVYASADRRLLEFAGTGNVRDGQGGNPQVRIVFEPAARTVTRADLELAIRAPLDGRCTF